MGFVKGVGRRDVGIAERQLGAQGGGQYVGGVEGLSIISRRE